MKQSGAKSLSKMMMVMQPEYMEQEEDWDRDLLLDPAWEKQQRKVSAHPFPKGKN